MSQGTPINKLGGGSMNDEDSRLVDSILNDLNNKPSDQQQQPSMPQQMNSLARRSEERSVTSPVGNAHSDFQKFILVRCSSLIDLYS